MPGAIKQFWPLFPIYVPPWIRGEKELEDRGVLCSRSFLKASDIVIIGSREQLDAWIRDNYWLHDASAVWIEPLPGDTLPSAISLTLQFQVAGGYIAGEQRTIRTVELAAQKVHAYELCGTYHPEHCAEGVNSFDTDIGIGFEIDVPGLLRIAASCFEVKSTVDVNEAVPEWLSDRSFTVFLSDGLLPTPHDWLNDFQRLGYDVVWRYYAGDDRSPEAVPRAEYSGWFVQKRTRLAAHTGGIFFGHCKRHEGGHSLTIEKNDPQCNDLWQAAGNILSLIEGVQIHCGNATVSAEALREHLAMILSTRNSGTEQVDEL